MEDEQPALPFSSQAQRDHLQDLRSSNKPGLGWEKVVRWHDERVGRAKGAQDTEEDFAGGKMPSGEFGGDAGMVAGSGTGDDVSAVDEPGYTWWGME